MIHKCTCVHPMQDDIHGKGNRVMNTCKPKESGNFVRCTVCGKEYTIAAKKATTGK